MESDRNVYSHPPSSTYFWKGSWQTAVLEDHEGIVSTGGGTITNLRFADDIDGLEGEEEEPAKFVEHLHKACTAYDMEIDAEKTKLMTNNISDTNIEIKANGQKL